MCGIAPRRQRSHRTTSRESTGVNVVAIQVLRVPERGYSQSQLACNLLDWACGCQDKSVRNRLTPISNSSQAAKIIGKQVETMNEREAAWCLLTEFTQSESLRKHALAVEACMRAYARKTGADEELWGMVGLLHDFDYEKYPSAEEHPYKGCEILKERGYSEEVRRAIMSHAEYTGVARSLSAGKNSVRLRRTGRIHHRLCAGQSREIASRGRSSVRAKENEGQGLRPQRSPGRHHCRARPILASIWKSTSPSASRP